MKRLKVVLGACLAMLVGFTALAWAATQYKTTIKVNGTKLNVQRYVEGKGPMKDKAVLLNKDNKVVVRWKQRELKKWYYDGDKYFRFVPYSYDMKNLKPGRYRLVTTSSFGKGGAVKKTVNISYKPQSKMQFRASKIIRKGNGDVYQRLYFKKNNSTGKTCYAQIFNKNNKLVYSTKYKARNANQDFAFSWNGWASGKSGKKCAKGVYTVKYWMDGVNPKTAKFRLSI